MSTVGFCCHLNRNSSLGHHNRVGDFSRLNPGANTAGFCNIGSNSTIGIGAVCIEKISIGSNSMVGGGAVVASYGRAIKLRSVFLQNGVGVFELRPLKRNPSWQYRPL